MKNNSIPTIFVVLGATGDLMTKKIVPALFSLHEKKELPPQFKLLGVSRREWTDDDFREHVRSILAKSELVESFLKLSAYHKLTFHERGDYDALKVTLTRIDDQWGVCTNKLFYLSVPPQFYDVILENLHASKLTEACSAEEGWTRVVVEKPFGNDEKSAKALDARLTKLFKEVQIYRVDHYLGKDPYPIIRVAWR
jgi:glucose-6-phosphate 1-dehydrogenase